MSIGKCCPRMCSPKWRGCVRRQRACRWDFTCCISVPAKTWPDVAHHTVWFGERYRELIGRHLPPQSTWRRIFPFTSIVPRRQTPPLHRKDVTASTCSARCPNLSGGQDWAIEGPRLRDRIVAALDATMLPGLAETITAEFAMTPEDFRDDYLSGRRGRILAFTGFYPICLFPLPQPGRGREGALLFVGAGTHPGAGLPGVISSAKVLDQLLPKVELDA